MLASITVTIHVVGFRAATMSSTSTLPDDFDAGTKVTSETMNYIFIVVSVIKTYYNPVILPSAKIKVKTKTFSEFLCLNILHI